MAINLNSLGNATAVPKNTRQGNGKHSIVIVCSDSNGKRITLSKALTTDLGVPENGGTLYITLYIPIRRCPLCFKPFGITGYCRKCRYNIRTGDEIICLLTPDI